MSSLILYTDPKQALVVTDTLAAAPDGSPFLFTTKAHYLPHLQTIVAGTGVGRFADDWFIRLNSRLLVSGIEELNRVTPQHLRELWAELDIENTALKGKSTTVYHIGISEETHQITAFSYRSSKDFEPRRLDHGVISKPVVKFDGDFYSAIPSMMERQRINQAKRPLAERIHIGGEAMAINLRIDGECSHYRMFRFADFDQQDAEARSNLP